MGVWTMPSKAMKIYHEGKELKIEGFNATYQFPEYTNRMVELTPSAVRPTGDLHSVPHYRCGICNRAVVLFEKDPHPDKCPWCGIPIDWDDGGK